MRALSREGKIEDRIIRAKAALGYAGADVIRRCRVGRYVGIVDLLLLPKKGKYKVVLIEVKSGENPEGQAKVVGQLLLYRAGVLKMGTRGLDLMREFARSQPKVALKESMSSLKMLSGGTSPPDAAWQELQTGDRISPNEIRLMIGLDVAPSDQLQEILTMIRPSGIEIDVVTAPVRGKVRITTGKSTRRKAR